MSRYDNSRYSSGGALSEEEKRKRAIQNSARRITVAGGEVPRATKTPMSMLGKGVMGALDLIDRPREAFFVAARQSGLNDNPTYTGPKMSIAEAFSKGLKKEMTYSGYDMAKDLGIKNKAAQFGVGLAAEVIGDPLTYATFGLGGLAKGFAKGTGTTLTPKAAAVATKGLASEARNKTIKEYMNQYQAANFKDLAKKMGTDTAGAYNTVNKAAFGKHYDDAVAAMPQGTSRQIYEVASRSYGAEAAKGYEKTLGLQAGPGLSFMGAKIKTGAQMQDAGAAIRQAITGKSKVAGKVGDTAETMFNTKRIVGADSQVRDFYRHIKNQAQGERALHDANLAATFKDLETLQKGLTYKGEPIQMHLEAITRNPDLVLTPQQMDTVITLTPQQKFAAARIASKQRKTAGSIADPDNMTLRDLINVYKREYQSTAIDETRAGLLKGDALHAYNAKADPTTGQVKDMYWHRAKNLKAGGKMVRGGAKGNMSVSNVFAMKRQDKFNGMTSAEINEMIREKLRNRGQNVPDDYQFLTENAYEALVRRKLSSNKMLADKDMMERVLGTFGDRMYTVDDINAAKAMGFDIVIPKSSYNLISPDSINFSKVVDPLDSKATSTILQVQASESLLQSISSDSAENLLAQMKKGARIYAMEPGIVKKVNDDMNKQLSEGLQLVVNTANKFYRIWKPLVTGLRPQYHTRNLVSSTFNNFLDLGVKMFEPDTQAISAAVAVVGRGKTYANQAAYDAAAKVSVNVGGKTYSAKNIYDMMIENNAINTFFLTDSTDIAQGIAKEALASQKNVGATLAQRVKNAPSGAFDAATGAGKAVGNSVEEYVRAINFVGNLKRGLDPRDAAEMVRKYHFDYQDLTDFEKALKGSLIPFYTWMRKNMPLQLEQFLNDPRIYQTLNRAAQTGADVEEMDYDMLPDYIKERFGIPFGRGKDDRIRIIDPGLPVEDLFTSGKDLAMGMNPIIKAVYEAKSGKSMLTGAPTRSYPEENAVELIQYINTLPIPDGAKKYAASALMTPAGVTGAQIADYVKNNSGVFRDMATYRPYGTNLGENQIIHQGRAVTDQEGLAAIPGYMFDPNFTKYYSPQAAERSEDYARQRQLNNVIQMMKDLGVDVKTINEIQKKGRY